MPKTHTQEPLTTGSSVVGLKYRDGVILAADNLASYGSLARFMGVPRLLRVNERIALGCTGDYADFQYTQTLIEEKQIGEEALNDGHSLTPRGLFTWLTRVQYNRRSKMDPLWCNWLVAGLGRDGVPFLGAVDKLGAAWEAPVICTGYGSHLATPLLRDLIESRDFSTLSAEEARALVVRCMGVLFSRDGRATKHYHIAIVDAASGARVEGPFTAEVDWSIGHHADEGEILLDTFATS